MEVSVIQPDIMWENKSANFKTFDRLISPLSGKADIIVLPEMFNTGFSMESFRFSEEQNGETLHWMQQTALRGNFGVCGSYMVVENKQFFNRFVFTSPENGFVFYDKRHLFRMGEENKFFSGGKSKLVFKFRGMRISPYVCYDLRFPVWSRNHNNYDLAIYVANWPESRINVWNTLLKARAIENQCYVVGSNRIGIDEKGIIYNGLSQIINPLGEIIISADPNKECSISAEISLSELNNLRKKFNVFDDADEFEIIE